MEAQIAKLNRQLEWERKRTKYAWAKYFSAERFYLEGDTHNAGLIREIVSRPEIPQFILNELKDLLAELNKRIECPVCKDDMEPDDLAITNCGHKYCQGCLDILKGLTPARCAVCRKSL
jgi:hypothetical protein